ncbi:LLM class F420-dependent oxidoreductase [Parafrigoribacterium mesophilum]|uniref:TIGR03560 family F420-dependent LLM class oxidoreductase n=1 Tax=Parafrigoribacterium mesophilum TaxID=433646 RepID=UPI0031FD01D1
MRVSIDLSNHALDADPRRFGDVLATIGKAADGVGLHTVWLPDHVVQADPTAGADRDVFEAYTALGFLARATRRVRLGTMVSAVTYRPIALLIKAVTTLDVLSGGRAWLGLGAGYLEQEATTMGMPLPPTGERFDDLEDSLELAGRMWSGDESKFQGRHTALDAPELHPRPLSSPHPPILIGGSGEKRTLRLVARYAQAANLFDIPDGGQTIARKIAVLEQHCHEVGRDPNEIERTLSTRQGPDQSVADFVEHCRDVAQLGIDHVILHSGPAWSPESVRDCAAIVDALADVTRRPSD